MFCGLSQLISWISRPVATNIMTPIIIWFRTRVDQIQMSSAPHLRSFLIITKKLDAVLENSPFCAECSCCFLSIDHTFYKCTIFPLLTVFEWTCFLNSFFLTVMTAETKGSARGSVFSSVKQSVNPLIWWRGRISVNPCLPYAGQASFTVCQGRQQQCPLTLILYLPLCVSVFVCRCHDCGERCDLTAEWCAAWREDWEPINTLPFFTPHISLVFIVRLKIVCDCLSGTWQKAVLQWVCVASQLYYMAQYLINTNNQFQPFSGYYLSCCRVAGMTGSCCNSPGKLPEGTSPADSS